jgi:hypothetical protein
MAPDFPLAFVVAFSPVFGPIAGERCLELFPESAHGAVTGVLKFGDSHDDLMRK